MLSEHKEILQQEKTSLTALLNTVDFPHVLQDLVKQQVISNYMRSDILCQSPQHEQIFLLVDILATSGDKSFDIFYQILKTHGYKTAAALLKPNDFELVEADGDVDGLLSQRFIGYNHREVTRYEASYTARAVARARAEKEFKAENDLRSREKEIRALTAGYEAHLRRRNKGAAGRDIYDRIESVYSDLPTEWPLPERCHENYYKYIQVNTDTCKDMIHKYNISSTGHHKQIYKMSAAPRGYLLVINNKHFPANDEGQDMTRQGSDIDVAAIQVLFKQLNFTVDVRSDLTAQEMRETLVEYSQMNHTQYDCFICIIASHGDDGGIVCTDRHTIPHDEVYEYFDHEHCPTLKNKPKIFLIQACFGGKEERSSERDSLNTQRNHEGDFFASVCTMPDYQSLRDPVYGSWFLFTWIYVIEKFSHKNHLIDLSTKVTNLVQQFGFKDNQTPNTTTWLTKDLYLFPGLYQQNNPGNTVE
ncbi:caspase-3 [Patella vulgata]|uniref:caspase-3 n=1 Tax=Patella vulgata TaxID=6465 RepID=UPI0024A91072|nr:caspase-3 [Patella vulgata]XP_055958392.1 caspase-3 [Patella vulgata]